MRGEVQSFRVIPEQFLGTPAKEYSEIMVIQTPVKSTSHITKIVIQVVLVDRRHMCSTNMGNRVYRRIRTAFGDSVSRLAGLEMETETY